MSKFLILTSISLTISLVLLFLFNNQFGEIQNVVSQDSCYYLTNYGFPLSYNYRGEIYLEKLFLNFIYFFAVVFFSVFMIERFFSLFKNTKYSILKFLFSTVFLLVLVILLFLFLGLDDPNVMSCRPFTIHEQRESMILGLVSGLIIWVTVSLVSYAFYKIFQIIYSKFGFNLGKK